MIGQFPSCNDSTEHILPTSQVQKRAVGQRDIRDVTCQNLARTARRRPIQQQIRTTSQAMIRVCCLWHKTLGLYSLQFLLPHQCGRFMATNRQTLCLQLFADPPSPIATPMFRKNLFYLFCERHSGRTGAKTIPAPPGIKRTETNT